MKKNTALGRRNAKRARKQYVDLIRTFRAGEDRRDARDIALIQKTAGFRVTGK